MTEELTPAEAWMRGFVAALRVNAGQWKEWEEERDFYLDVLRGGDWQEEASR